MFPPAWELAAHENVEKVTVQSAYGMAETLMNAQKLSL